MYITYICKKAIYIDYYWTLFKAEKNLIALFLLFLQEKVNDLT